MRAPLDTRVARVRRVNQLQQARVLLDLLLAAGGLVLLLDPALLLTALRLVGVVLRASAAKQYGRKPHRSSRTHAMWVCCTCGMSIRKRGQLDIPEIV